MFTSFSRHTQQRGLLRSAGCAALQAARTHVHATVVPVQMLQQGFEGRPVNFRQTLDKRGVLLHSLPLVLFICGIHTDKNKENQMKWTLEAQKEVIFCLNL